MCIKGKAAPELLYHPDRLNYPLKRTRPKGDPDPGWVRISWDQALSDIAEKLVAIRERHGPEAIALAKGTGSGTSIDDAVRWLARFLNVWGSPNWVSTTHVCNWHRDTGFSFTFGPISRRRISRTAKLSCSGVTIPAQRRSFLRTISLPLGRGE